MSDAEFDRVRVRTQACPSCIQFVTMVPYDIGSGPEMICPYCQWCWGADGQDLKPLDMKVVREAMHLPPKEETE